MKNSRQTGNRENKGITLIALVVSVVVLIILALIGINIAFNDDGVFKSAKQSEEVQSNSTIKEREMANMYVTELEDDLELKLAVTQKVKSQPANKSQYVENEVITYEVTVTNTGKKNLVDLELSGKITRPDRTEGIPSGLPDGTKIIDRLDVEQSETITYTHTVENKDLGGNLKNEVKVVGYAEDNPKESAESVSRVTVATESFNSNLTIEKEITNRKANDEPFQVGEIVKYKITVKNNGNSTVAGIKVEDTLTAKDNQTGKQEIRLQLTFTELKDKDGNVIGNKLNPEQEGYIEYEYKIVPEDFGKELTNKAQVRGKKPIQAGEKIDIEEDKLKVTKTVNNRKSKYKVGETIEYLITVENTGTKTIEGITVEDILSATDNEDIKEILRREFKILYTEHNEPLGDEINGSTLAGGQKGYIKYNYLVTPEDLGKTLWNEAYVQGRKPPIPPGEKVETDDPTGTLTITKAYYNEENSQLGAKFKITLRDKTGKELTDQYPYYRGNTEKGTIQSGGTFALNNGEGYTIIGLPDGTQYTVEEIEASPGYNFDIESKREGTIDLSKSLVESEAFINSKGARMPSTGGEFTITTNNEKAIRFELLEGNVGNAANYDDIKTKAQNLELRLYHVASWSPDNPVIKVEEKYKGCSINDIISDTQQLIVGNYQRYREKEQEIGEYIIKNGIAPDYTLKIGNKITEYKDGLYLAMINDTSQQEEYYYKTDIDGGGNTLVNRYFTDKCVYSSLPTLLANYLQLYANVDNEFEQLEESGGITIKYAGCREQSNYGDLKIVTTVQSHVENTVAPFVYEVSATLDGKIVYTNVVSTEFTEPGQQSIDILDEIEVGAEVTVRCVYSGVYNLTESDQQTVLVDSANEMASVNFGYDYGNTCQAVTSTTHSFKYDGEEWQYSKDKEESIGYGIGDNRVGIGLLDDYTNWTIINNIQIDENSDDVSVRVKAFAPTGVNLVVSSEDEVWSQNRDDGYCYYNEILTAGEASEPLNITIEDVNEETNQNFNVVVVVEAVKVQYDENGNAYPDWYMEYNFDEETESGKE